MPIQRRGKEPRDERRDADMIRLEPVDQHHHALVLVVDHVARLRQRRECAFADRDGARAADLLPAAVDGRVVAGEVGRDGDAFRLELGHLGELLADDLAGGVAGEVRVSVPGGIGRVSCLDRGDGGWVGGYGDSGGGEEEDDGREMHLEGLWLDRAARRSQRVSPRTAAGHLLEWLCFDWDFGSE